MLLKNRTLLQSRLFAGLPTDVAGALTNLAELKTFAPHEKIHAEGDKAVSVYLVLSGLVRLARSESAGREADIAVCEAGDMFDEYLVAGGDVYAYAAWAAAYTEVAVFELRGLKSLAEHNLGLQSNLIRLMAGQLLNAFDCVAADRLHTASQRVANYFLSRCPASVTQTSFRLPYQKRILAGKLGLAPEALSRAFSALASSGVDVRGRTVRIGDVSLLRKVC